MGSRRLSIAGVAVVVVGALAWPQASEASHFRGIRATVQDVEPATNSVDVSFTLFQDTTERTSEDFVQVYVQWGEGEATVTTLEYVDETVTLEGEGLFVFRGSLSHTYSSNEPQTITVDNANANLEDNCCPAEAQESIYAGNLVHLEGQYSIGEISPSEYYLTNTTLVSFGGVPSLPGYGLLILALTLLALGLMLMRRRAIVGT